MSDHTEREFKLRATKPIEVALIDASLHELGARCRLADRQHHVDTYLDDARGSLRRCGIGLRLRRGELQQQLTCKAPALRDGALFVRDEHNAIWPDDAPPTRASDLPDELRHRIEPLVLDRPLAPVLRLAVRRERRMLVGDAGDQCELAIDHVEVRSNGRSATFQEVELEVLDDLDVSMQQAEQLTEQLRTRLPLVPCDQDKPSYAEALLGLERSPLGTPNETAASPIGATLMPRLAALLDAIAAAEPIARAGMHAEGVHQMRVATRRLRTLLRAFVELWPEPTAQRLLAHQRETSRRLANVRDFDVLLATLPGDLAHLPPALASGGELLRQLLQQQRDARHGELVTWLGSRERLAEAAWCADLLRTGSEAPESLVATEVAVPASLAMAVKRLRRRLAALPKAMPLPASHRLRLAAKRVRDLAEPFTELLALDAGRALRNLHRAQQAIGKLRDDEVAARALLIFLHGAMSTADPCRLSGAIGSIATMRLLTAQSARKHVKKSVERMHGNKAWRKLLGAPGHDAKMA